MDSTYNKLIMSANDPKRTFTLQTIRLMKALILIVVACFPFLAYSYDFNGNTLGDSCEKAISDELNSGASQLSSYDNSLARTIRHVFFLDHETLDGVARYDCKDDVILREDLTFYFESKEEALPYFDLLSNELSEKIQNKVYDSQEEKSSLKEDLFDAISPKERWSIWVDGKNKTDLILFKYENMWRLFLRTKITTPQMEKARELSLVVGLDL